MIDDNERLVGCLLYPGQNGGIDLRGTSFYGAELCSGHLCPSHHFLSQTEKRIIADLLDDWHLYGLCITDIDLIKEYFRHISDRLGEAPAPERFREGCVRPIDYASCGCERSRFDGILLNLSSVLGSRQELQKAEAMIKVYECLS